MPASSPLDRHPGRLCLAIAVAYALGSELAWHSFGANVGLAFFPPAGITVAALLLTRRQHWPALLATVFVTETVVDVSQHLGTRFALAYAVANTVEPFVGALIVQRLNPERVTLDFRRGKVAFLLGAGAAGPAAGALVGATAASFHRPGTVWVDNFVHWWAGDGIAVLAIGATILLCVKVTIGVRHRVELVIGAAATVAIAVFGLASPLAPATLALPLVALMAIRVGPVGATVSGGVFAVVANYWTNAGHGYFAELDASPAARLAYLQLFIAVLVVVGWSIGIEVQTRLRAVEASIRLERQRDDATAAVHAIHRAIAPRVVDANGPFGVGACYRQSDVGGLVGGDWYDVFELPDGRVMFSVGDVVGRGIVAVEDMAQLRLAARALACEGHDSADVVAELSRYARTATHGRFATMVLAIFEPVQQTITIASAGHPPPLRWRSHGASSEYLPVRPGPPLGVPSARAFEPMTVRLEPGDVLVMFTDGVVERRDHSLDDGLAALRARFDARVGCPDASSSLDELCEALVGSCHDDLVADDDRCVLAVRFGDRAARAAAWAKPVTAQPEQLVLDVTRDAPPSARPPLRAARVSVDRVDAALPT